MNKAVMVRKALNLTDLREKAKEQKAENIVIEKKIVLSPEEYQDLCDNLFERREYIIENDNIMYQDNDGWHCILVTTTDNNTGIAISSEGFDYAKYAAEVKISDVTVKPEVKIIWHGKEQADEILKSLNLKLIWRFNQFTLDQTNADSEIRLNLRWKGSRAIWTVKVFSNPIFTSQREMTAYIGKLVKYKQALKRLHDIYLRFEVEDNE